MTCLHPRNLDFLVSSDESIARLTAERAGLVGCQRAVQAKACTQRARHLVKCGVLVTSGFGAGPQLWTQLGENRPPHLTHGSARNLASAERAKGKIHAKLFPSSALYKSFREGSFVSLITYSLYASAGFLAWNSAIGINSISVGLAALGEHADAELSSDGL